MNANTFRWKIARLLDRLFPDICWTMLASWALFPQKGNFWEILEYRHTAGGCARNGEYNYCGKCDKAYPEATIEEWVKRQENDDERDA